MNRHIVVNQIKSEKSIIRLMPLIMKLWRSHIDEKANANFNKNEAGTVYLTFIIAKDGSLKDSQLIEEKTHASPTLKSSALKSLQQADFPPFFAGMTLPEYTFNIEIQYQVSE